MGNTAYKGILKQEIFNEVNENVKALERLFPSAVKDGQVDFQALKEELGQFEEVGPERYGLNWSGKQNAKRIAQQDIIGKTLKYIPEESKNPETTENLYIEGDNLEVLKLLRQNYYGAIKMIYIDPPYNTGNDFVYNDSFTMDKLDSDIAEGDFSELGERYKVNSKSTNRYHANWLNMMYPRLKVAKDLLRDDGVILISIDDNEYANIETTCEDIFGEYNKIAEFVVIRAEGGGLAKQVIKGHEYLLVYAKDSNKFKPLAKAKDIRGKIIEKYGEKFWIQEDWLRKEFGKYGNCHYEEILEFKGESKLKEINIGLKNGDYILIPKSNGMNVVGRLRSLKEDSSKFYSILKHLSANGVKDLNELELNLYFDYPKPVSLIKELISGATFFSGNNDDIVLDFFSGSSTTAHAVMQLNAEDGGNRKFIMVQIPEETDEKSEARKAGYKNICDIGKERIRRAGYKIKAENKDKEGIDNLDIGFKVFRVSDTNIRWEYESDNLKTLASQAISTDKSITIDEIATCGSNGKLDEVMPAKDNLDFMSGVKDIDVVYEILLRQRDIPLSAKVELLSDIGKRTYIFADSYVVCLEKEIKKELVEKLAYINPLPIKYIFRDSAFGDDIVLKDETTRRLDTLIKCYYGTKAYKIEYI